MTLTSYIEQGMNSTQIVDLIFDLHRDFINPKVIARRQVTRLVDRLLNKVAPELILNRHYDNKENSDGNNAASATPAKALIHVTEEPVTRLSKPEMQSSGARKNLALQLGAARQEPSSNNAGGAPYPADPQLDQAPESERSEAFSMPVSEELNSARQNFNQVQTLKMSGKSGEGMLSSGQKSVN